MGKKTLEEMVSEIEERTNVESEVLIKDKENLSFFSCLSKAVKAYRKSYRGKRRYKRFCSWDNTRFVSFNVIR